MADLVIDTGYKKRFAKESLLSLPELMLRWPFQCFLKIPFELFNKRLIPYFLLEKSLIMRKFDLCTPQNINELAIPFSYIMSKYGNKFYFNNFVPYNVEHDFFREHLTHHFHMLLIK